MNASDIFKKLFLSTSLTNEPNSAQQTNQVRRAIFWLFKMKSPISVKRGVSVELVDVMVVV